MRRTNFVEELARDLTFAFRSLRTSPAFTLTVLLSLALGLGANTAVFSLIDTLVFRPLQVEAPRQLVRIGSLEKNGTIMPLPGPILHELRKDPLIAGVCGFTAGDAAVAFRGGSAVVPTLSVTGDCFKTLGIHAALGRLLTQADDDLNAPHVAVLGYRFWRDKLAGNPGVLGNTIKISGVPFQIVGVTQSSFDGLLWGFPMGVSAPISQRTVKTAQDPSGRFYWAETIARPRDGVQLQSLKAQLKTKWGRLLDAALPPGFKGANRSEIVSMSPVVVPCSTPIDYYFRDHFEKPLFVLLAISVLVLLVACMNVANLLLARGLHRTREIAIRLAVGAVRWRIVRQLGCESIVLLAVGLALGFGFALVGSRALVEFFIVAYNRPDFSFAVDLDWRVLLFTALAACIAVLTFAILPAWRTADVDPATALKGGSRSITGSRARIRKTLLMAQVTMTFVILVSAMAFVQSSRYLRDNVVNFDTETVLDAQLMPLEQPGSTHKHKDSYLLNLLEDVRSLPGVRRVSMSSFAPLVSVPFIEDVRRVDRPNDALVRAAAEFVTDDFLKIMHIPLLQGRDFERTEAGRSQRSAIISQSVARHLFQTGQGIGRHIEFGTEPETRDLEVVGIVADPALEDPHSKNGAFVLLNLWQQQWVADWGNLQIQFSGPPASVISELRKEIEEAGFQQIFLLNTIGQLRDRSLLQDRLLAAIGTVYVGLVLVLAAVGLLGLLLFFVENRKKEIAIRVALGAEQHEISTLVAREAALLIAAGILIGLPASYAVIHTCSSLLYGVPNALIRPALSGVVALSAIGILSILVPMYQASRIIPTALLRDS